MANVTDNTIKQEVVEPKYYARIPNIIYHLGLSPHANTLYGVLKRTAGDSGVSFKSTKTLALECSMSTGKVSESKKELCQEFSILNGKPLIQIAEKERPSGGRPYHEITIVNIWPENVSYFEKKKHASSRGELASSNYEQASSRGESKKNTQEEKHTEEDTPSPKNDTRSMTDEEAEDFINQGKKQETQPRKKRTKEDIKAGITQAMVEFEQNLEPLQEVLDEITLKNNNWKAKSNQDLLLKLRDECHATPEKLRAFRRWWDTEDWRGKKGDPPRIAQVYEEWPTFMNDRGGGKGKVIRI